MTTYRVELPGRKLLLTMGAVYVGLAGALASTDTVWAIAFAVPIGAMGAALFYLGVVS